MFTMFKKHQCETKVTYSLWKEAVELSFVAIAYWAAVRLGLLMVAQPEGIASVWPASGLALAVLLLRPKRRWGKLLAVIFLTNAAGNLNGGNSLPVSMGFALANTLETGFGAWTLTALCKSTVTFERTREVLALLFVAVVMNAITALLGAVVSVLAFHSVFIDCWMVWWAADGLGIMLITPFIIGWVANKRPLSSIFPRHIVDGVLIALSLTLFAWLVFGSFTVAEKPILRSYMVFPLLIWLVFRFSPRNVATALLLFSVAAVWNTLHGHGLFSFESQTWSEHLGSLQIFLSVLTFSGLLLSTIVTARKQAEKALQISEAKFRSIIEVCPALLALNDDRQCVIFLNPAFIRTFGYTLEEIPTLSDWWPKAYPDPDYRHWVSKTWLDRVETVRRSGGDFKPMEVIIRCKDETRRTVLASASSLAGLFEDTHLVTLHDITGLKQTEEMLKLSREHVRRLVQNLETVREEEHKHFADELHDELGQILTAIKIDLAAVADKCSDGQLKEKIGETQALLSKGILGVHLLCHRLRPGSLDDLGLKETLIDLVEEWQPRNETKYNFSADINEDALSEKIKTTVFRIVQEALTNVSCHARASKVWITLGTDEKTLRFSVADNGCGMEPGTENRLTSFGLLRMREYLEAINGKLRIESSPGRGTRIEGTIPLTKKG